MVEFYHIIDTLSTGLWLCCYTSGMAGERKSVTVNVRFPDHVHQQLSALAEEDDRSLNGEIVHAVRQFIAQRQRRQEPRVLRCAEEEAGYDA